MRFNYYFGNECEQFRFYQVPKAFLKEPEFKRLSLSAKLLYSVLRDRMMLSVQNGWVDELSQVYIVYPISDLAQALGVCDDTAGSLLKELESFGLIDKRRLGQGKANLIYVKNFMAPIDTRIEPSPTTSNTRTVQKPKKSVSRNRHSRSPETENIGPIHTDIKETVCKDTISLTHSVEPRQIDRPKIAVGAHEELSEDQVQTLSSVIEQHNGIPASYGENPTVMKQMMMYLCRWKQLFCGEPDHTVRERIQRTIIAGLTEMALEKQPWTCRKGETLTSEPVLDAINAALQDPEDNLLTSLVERVVDKFIQRKKEQKIQSPKAYIKALLWDQLSCPKLEDDVHHTQRSPQKARNLFNEFEHHDYVKEFGCSLDELLQQACAKQRLQLQKQLPLTGA